LIYLKYEKPEKQKTFKKTDISNIFKDLLKLIRMELLYKDMISIRRKNEYLMIEEMMFGTKN